MKTIKNETQKLKDDAIKIIEKYGAAEASFKLSDRGDDYIMIITFRKKEESEIEEELEDI